MIAMKKRTIAERLIIANSLIAGAIADADNNQFRDETKMTDDAYRSKKMGRLDDVISEVNCILGILLAYRDIVQTGDCNECAKKMGCEYVPKAGQVVRYNCPFYEKDGDADDEQ